MKRFIRAIAALFILLILLLPYTSGSTQAVSFSKGEFRGLWVATVANTDYPSKPTTDPAVLKAEAIKILDNAKSMGINVVFLQVRSTEDALYKSKIFPWSKYLTGTQGLAPADGFDPLAFWVTEAHSRDIELHAWINPYRITKSKESLNSLYAANPARLHPDWVVKYSDNNLYFNPGIPEARKLIVDGIREILDNYAVDGIHFDDYFYPGRTFNDSSTYKAYGKGYTSIGNWRRANVSALVSDVSQAVKASGKNIRFGISPFGIWANKSSNQLGSDTKGLEAYNDHYADTRKWVKDGMIDYIVPQIYWQIGYSIADYSKLLSWWSNVASGTGVDLYIGQATYRACSSSTSSVWYGISEIERQLKLNEKYPEVKGSVFYNYTSLADNPGLGAAIKTIFEKRDGITAAKPIIVSWPSGNIQTSYTSYYLNGASDPGKPLYFNGKPVEGRSSQGYFGFLASLENGSNIFTFSQDGTYVTRVIYRKSPVEIVTKMSKIEIPVDSVFPTSQEYRTPGEKITLTCQAPAGSKVSVKIGGKSYVMKPSSALPRSGVLIPAKYTYTYTMPSCSGTPRTIDLGAPVYTLSYKGSKKSRTAPAKIGVIMAGSPFYAEVSKEDIDTFKSINPSYGAAYELRKGMTDYITGMTGSYARLSSGLWVRKTSISTYTSRARLQPAIISADYQTGDKWDTLKFNYSSSLAAIADFDGSKLTVGISAAVSGVTPALPDNALFSSAVFTRSGNQGQYVLSVKSGQTIDGYYIEKAVDGIVLHIKRPAKTTGGFGSLQGITIMLDPGHGGTETGAIGPLGLTYAEKAINLDMGLKLRTELQALGATVLMTRTSDVTVSLPDRLTASRNAKPDMFLSIHANSMEDNVDISKIFGFSVHYKEALAKPLSEAILAKAAEIGRMNKGTIYNNFYVVRGTWTPSMLMESGFVPNPAEFETLISDSEQSRLAKSIAEGIARYFSRSAPEN
jgi:uncharacterized lipoprotein YddW (UPF0748 family)/N-acetylmuramoyl-L-alanine amidase